MPGVLSTRGFWGLLWPCFGHGIVTGSVRCGLRDRWVSAAVVIGETRVLYPPEARCCLSDTRRLGPSVCLRHAHSVSI